MESPEETMSTCSDLSESIISSVSGVGGYQEELEELRHLINPLKYLQTSQRNCRTPTQDFHHLPDNDRIKELSGQLHNALSLNEKYKSDLYNLEKKLELSYYDKIDGLIRKNKQLELQVENSNGQIERLIKNFGNVKSNLTCAKCLHLEKLNFELNSQVLSLKDELVYCKSVHNKVSDENRQLSIEIQDIKPLIDIKNVCIKDLKGKISEQHVEIQNHIRDLDVLNGSINSLRNDLSHTKKSEEWYKEQLHVCQKEKCSLTDDVLKWRATATAYNKDVEHYKIELNNLRIKYNDLELKCLRDKEKLTRFVPMIVETKQFTQSSNDITTNKSLADYYEKTIEDLYCEINRVKDSIQQKDATYSNIAGENSQLTSQCLMLQKSIQLNESHLEDQNILIKDLQRKLILETNNTNDKTQQLMDLKVKLQKIQVELTARNQEKLMVESTIETIRQQFTLLKNNYEHLKCDLNDKNKEIMHLQTEKQELFMNNNWNVCELEKVREQVLMIKKLQEIIQKYEGELGTVQKSIEDYEQKIKVLNDNILEQQQGFALEKDGLKHQYDNNILNYDKIIIQYKDLVQTNDVKIADMHQRIEENDSVVAQLKDNIEILKMRIKQQDAELCKLKRDYEQKLSNLESHNKSLLSDNKKLQECYNNYILDFQDDSGISVTEDAAGDCKVEESARVGLRRKISDLQSGVSVLQTKTDRTYANLQKFSSMRGQQDDGGLNDSDEIKNLKALLKLKELERKEKQKKYEHNYRTLLRKVKEHMKGRNLAEKQNATLQTLYNTLADDNNKLKLDLSSKDYEIGNVKKLLDDYASINKKLKQSLANIEQELENKQFCKQCIEYEINLKKLSDLEIHIGNFQKENGIVQEELLKKTELVNGLKERIRELTQINDDLQVDGNKNRDKAANLAVENTELNKKLIHLEKKEEETKKLMMEVTQLELQIKNVNNDRQQINAHLQDVTEKYDFICEAHKVLSCQLHKKDEDIKQLEKGKLQLEETNAKKDLEFTGLIEKLKKHIQQQQSELESNKTEKYFLQRLCNDLKIALQSNVNQNKSLKQHLGKLMKGPEEYNSLPMFLPEMPSNKYDDKYINDLLQQNKAPLQDKPLIEIKGCLDSLKNEIANLQDHISKKNLST